MSDSARMSHETSETVSIQEARNKNQAQKDIVYAA